MQILTIKPGAIYAGPKRHRLRRFLPTTNQLFSIRLRIRLWEDEGVEANVFRADGSEIEFKIGELTPGIGGTLWGASDFSFRFNRVKWFGLQALNNLNLEDSDEILWKYDGEKIKLTRSSMRRGNVRSESSIGSIYPDQHDEWRGWSEEFSVTIHRVRGAIAVTFLVIQHDYRASLETGLELTEDRQVFFGAFETSYPVSRLQSTYSSWLSIDRRTGGPYQLKPITFAIFKND